MLFKHIAVTSCDRGLSIAKTRRSQTSKFFLKKILYLFSCCFKPETDYSIEFLILKNPYFDSF